MGILGWVLSIWIGFNLFLAVVLLVSATIDELCSLRQKPLQGNKLSVNLQLTEDVSTTIFWSDRFAREKLFRQPKKRRGGANVATIQDSGWSRLTSYPSGI
jgi:hypothetical protein